jgi:hypothetical protein
MRIHVPYSKAVMEAHEGIAVHEAYYICIRDRYNQNKHRNSPVDVVLAPILMISSDRGNPALAGVALTPGESGYDMTCPKHHGWVYKAKCV